MTNIYIETFREMIKNAKFDEEIDILLDRIYDDGFRDGAEAGKI